MKPTTAFSALCALLFAFNSTCLLGCGATCKRIEADRQSFLSRTASSNGQPHLEVSMPFALAEKLISKQLDLIEPVAIEVPGLGKLGAYFGQLKLRPSRIALLPAQRDRVGLELGFEVLVGSATAFSLFIDTEIKPQIDFSSGRVELAVEPESFEAVRPRLDSDSAGKLAKLIYSKIPSLARTLVSQDTVTTAAAATVDSLLHRFYAAYKDKLLRRVCRLTRLSLALPDIPVERIALSTVGQDGDGALLLLVTTRLPVSAGVTGSTRPTNRRLATFRLSAETAAELVNWAMHKGHLPNRYDKKGKPSETGELWAGLEWAPGERPMKIHLWQLEGSCKRIDLGADARISLENAKLRIDAQNAVIEGSKAAALTELGIFFVSLWKDAVDKTLRANAALRFEVAGREVLTTASQAALENDELILGLSVQIK
jgi:hypothetical protein